MIGGKITDDFAKCTARFVIAGERCLGSGVLQRTFAGRTVS